MELYRDAKAAPEARAKDLLQRMTLREKVGQLNQRLYGFAEYEIRDGEFVPGGGFRAEVERYSGMGALYGLYRADPWSRRDFTNGLVGELAPRARNAVQRYVMEHSRLGIPVLMATECPHGHQALDGCLLPVNLAAAACFDPALLSAAAAVSARQLAELGVDLALVSCLDVLRDPRWGRSEECFGEDPLLASRMAEAVISAMQRQGVDVVAKHLCAQGETTGGVNASAARIGERELREIHLPPAEAAVRAGVQGFMAAYNEIDGIYCHANRRLLTGYLRGELGFDGIVMSDGIAIDQLDAVTGSRMMSGALALNAGVDIGLWDTAFSLLEEAAEAGAVSTERIDEAAYRVLLLKFRRGLFDEPFVPETAHYQLYADPRRFPEPAKLAAETPVLLKNEGGALPLALAGRRILLAGPAADDLYAQLGDYTPPQRPGTGSTVRAALERLVPAGGGQLAYERGCGMFEPAPAEEVARMTEAAALCDAVVAVLGGSSSRFSGGEFDANGALLAQHRATMDCGEGVDAAELRLPGGQMELLRALRAAGKPVITVIIAGRPYAMAEIERLSDAILYCFYPGPQGGEAVARILCGELEPSGRLPASLPDSVGQLPVYYNYKDSYAAMRYYDDKKPPRWRFGSGMGYARFEHELLSAPEGELAAGGAICLRLALRNASGRDGAAVPQLYIHRTQGVATSRARQLVDWKKLRLRAGEGAETELSIPPEALRQWDGAAWVTPPGKIEWFLGDNGEDWASGEFTLGGTSA